MSSKVGSQASTMISKCYEYSTLLKEGFFKYMGHSMKIASEELVQMKK